MGRYSNVQSYSGDSPNMRTVTWEAATGRAAPAAGAAAEATNTRPGGSSTSDEGNGEAGANEAKLGSADAGEPRQQQTQARSAISPSSCDTTNLFVGGLHPRIGDLHLQKLFSPYGEIVRIHIVTHNPNEATKIPAKYSSLQQSKGYAFVEYKTIESARLAISRLDGRQLMGRRLAVRPSRRKMSDVARAGGGSSGKVDTKISAEEAKREYSAVQSKIEAVKRAIEDKKRGT